MADVALSAVEEMTRLETISLTLVGTSIIVSGTAYLVGVLVAGLVYGNRMAVAIALADLGVSYIAATVQMRRSIA